MSYVKPKKKFGLGGAIKDTVTGVGDYALGMLGAPDVIKDYHYDDTKIGRGFGKVNNKIGPYASIVGQTALNFVAPGAGTAVVGLGRQINSMSNPIPNDNLLANPQAQSAISGVLGQGLQTLAGGGGAPSMGKGGAIPGTKINVEEKELQVNKHGAIIRDFGKSVPPHPATGTDPAGDVAATPGNVIIPKNKRREFMSASIDKRREMAKEFSKKKPELVYGSGGGIPEQYGNFMAPLDTGTPTITNPRGSITAPNIDLSGSLIKSTGVGEEPGDYYAYGSGKDYAAMAGKAMPYVDNIANIALTFARPKVPKPELMDGVVLNNRLNVTDRLNSVNRTSKAAMESIAGNTNSGQILRNAALQNRANTVAAKDNIYADASRYKAEMDNKNKLINSEIDKYNKSLKNDYNLKEFAAKDDKVTEIGRNISNASLDAQGQMKDAALMDADVQKVSIASKLWDSGIDKRNFYTYYSTLPQHLKDKLIELRPELKGKI